eukprot:4788351-Pleurochrysis_carterae.AAC.1
MPAPVSPSHMVLALAAAIAGVDSRTDVREVVVERCVAVGDESYENEQEAAHRQSSWKIASQLNCSCQTLSKAWMRSQAARYALWMHAWVDGCDD